MTTKQKIAEEIVMSIHLQAGNLLDRGLTMQQVQEILHEAVNLVPDVEKGMYMN